MKACLPILGLLTGAFTGAWVSTVFGQAEIFGSIGGAISGLVMGYAAVITLDRIPSLRRRIMPTITNIVAPNVGISDIEKASCCD